MKRCLDIVVAGLGLLILSPVLLVVGLLVALRMGRPVFIRQQRPGLRGAPFVLVKFRTMTDECDSDGRLMPDARRLTPLGRRLRSTSIDELPELWNVLKGDMSLVGPRPLLMQYLDRYTPEQMRRHDVKPGLTGWAQVNGRNTLTWEEKFAHDVWYVDHVGFALDLKILLLTARTVLRREGIAHGGEVTMPEFMGDLDASRQDDPASPPHPV